MPPGQPEPPQPATTLRRYRWLKRFLVAIPMLLVGLLALRLVWGYIAQSRLDGLIAQYRAVGQPAAPDFSGFWGSVPEEDNAAIPYTKAIARFKPAYVSRTSDPLQDKRWWSLYRDDVEILVNENKAPLSLLRRARNCENLAWIPTAEGKPSLQLNAMRAGDLARVLAFACAYHFESADYAAGVASLRDLLALNHAVGCYPMPLHSMFSMGGDILLCQIVSRYSQSWQIKQYAPAGNGQPVDREEVEALIQELPDDKDVQPHAARSRLVTRDFDVAQYGDCSYTVAVYFGRPARAPQPPLYHALDWAARPAMVLDAANIAEFETNLAAAMTGPVWPKAAGLFDRLDQPPTLLQALSLPISESTYGQNLRNGAHHHLLALYRSLAMRRMAAIALAIRLYQLDTGARPADLAALTPKYLPDLPPDPFSPDAATFRYVPAAESPSRPARLYSLSADGLDQGGEEQSNSHYTGAGDFVFLLE